MINVFRSLLALLLIALPALAQDAPKIALKSGQGLDHGRRGSRAQQRDHLHLRRQDRTHRAHGGHRDPDGYTVVDHSDRWAVPGLIDCHNHVAGALSELNDGVYQTNPGLRTVDAVDPHSENLRRGLAGGVTTMLLIPGSGNNMSGFGTISRSGVDNVDDAVMRSPGSLKIAQCGNPERWYWGTQKSYMNWNLRLTLQKAKEYNDAWKAFESGRTKTRPDYDVAWHGLRGLMAQRFPATVHTQIYQVFMKTLTLLHDEFNIWTVPNHSTFDSYKAAELVIERDIHVIVGPRCYWMDPDDRTINGCAEGFWRGGVRKLGINTDAPVVAQENLTVQAAMAVRHGWETYPAIVGLTRVPAEALGIFDRVGSLEVGKDADICLWTGDPIDPRSSVELAIVMGRVAYDPESGRIY